MWWMKAAAVLQDVLTPWQEVWLDAGPVCPPWHGNLWAIGEALAVHHGLDPVRAPFAFL